MVQLSRRKSTQATPLFLEGSPDITSGLAAFLEKAGRFTLGVG